MPLPMGGQLLKAGTIIAGPPVPPRERVKGPPSRRPASRHLIRGLSIPLGCLAMLPQLQHRGAPHTNAVVVQGLQRDPLERVAHYRSKGWRKDLDLIFKAYYKYNFSSFKESEWSKLRDKVLEHLLPCQDEWRSLKENDPLQYMPYMEEQFYVTTGIRLKGLAKCTRWIKQGSYYHSVVARKEQLHKCPHLEGIELLRGPQITPSESCWASQKKAEAPVASSSVPVIEASAPQGATSNAPAPMEMGGAGDGQSWEEQAEVEDDFKRDRPTKCQGDGKTDQHFPSHSRMMREDAPPPRSSTGM